MIKLDNTGTFEPALRTPAEAETRKPRPLESRLILSVRTFKKRCEDVSMRSV